MTRHVNRPRGSPPRAQSSPAIVPGVGADVPELRQARGLWQLNRFDEALALFETVVRKYPQNLLALVDASRALGARFEITRAESLEDRSAAKSARHPPLLHRTGQSNRLISHTRKSTARIHT